jgi:hypothetical protein
MSDYAGPAELDTLAIAVLIPCFNEEESIEEVVRQFAEALPQAVIYVYDNNSTDRSAARALAAGAIVRQEPRPGKGNVVRRMFADVDADAYVLVDADGTYDAASAPAMVETLVWRQLDMVVAARTGVARAAYPRGHQLGNHVFTRVIARIFGEHFQDVLSGYRVFSRRFVRSFPAFSKGFEIETELAVHALQLRMPVAEMATPYRERPQGSTSKLHTLRDGWRILATVAKLVEQELPLTFFGALAVVLATASLALGWPLVSTFIETGLVPRLPTAVLASALMLLAFLSLTCGLVLDTVTRGRQEMKRLWYLNAVDRPVAPVAWTGANAARPASRPSLPVSPEHTVGKKLV